MKGETKDRKVIDVIMGYADGRQHPMTGTQRRSSPHGAIEYD